DRGAHRFARELDETLFEGLFDVGQRARVAMRAKSLLGHVPEKVPGIQSGIARAVEIEVQNHQAVAVDKNLIGVEVAMDAGRRTPGDGSSQALAGLLQTLAPAPPARLGAGHLLKALAQDSKLVVHPMPALGRNAAKMELASRLGDAPRERRFARFQKLRDGSS